MLMRFYWFAILVMCSGFSLQLVQHTYNEGGWTTCTWKRESLDVSEEEDHNEARWNLASTQFHLHPKACGFDESEWEEKEGFAIPCYVGKTSVQAVQT